MQKEVWNDIKGYEGLYEVSSLGRILSIKTGIYIKLTLSKAGYIQILISKEGLNFNHNVHRLVALAFIPNPENKPQVNHINGVKNDNRVENLEWVTSKENEWHKINILGKNPHKGKFGKDSIASIPVIQYDLNGIYIDEFESILQAYKETGILNTSISKCCKGKYKSAGGFVWKFKPLPTPPITK